MIELDYDTTINFTIFENQYNTKPITKNSMRCWGGNSMHKADIENKTSQVREVHSKTFYNIVKE